MSATPFNVLFLCTANSARSILAEALLDQLGAGRFRAYSAGNQPKGAVHPQALESLRAAGLPATGLRSKSWDEFEQAGAPTMDFIVTVCDNAAGETCPVWPGHPLMAHWGMADPAAVEGEAAQKAAFAATLAGLRQRIAALLALPVAALEPAALQAIGRMPGATAGVFAHG